MNVFVIWPKNIARTGRLAPVTSDMKAPTIISIVSQMSAYRNCNIKNIKTVQRSSRKKNLMCVYVYYF